MTSKKLAKFLSIILGPHILSPILFIVVIFKSNLQSNQLAIIFPTVLLLQVIIPVSYLIIAPKLGWVSEWDMKTQKERQPFFVLLFILTTISLFVIYLFGNKLLLHLNLIFLFLLIVLSAITIFWKISLHASLNTAVAIIINFLFDWKFPILFLVIPTIYWARLQLKKHSTSQLLAGITLTTLVTFGGLYLFGYL